LSVVRCDQCGDLIDSDSEPQCFTQHGDGPVLCAAHRCEDCDENPKQCDDKCVECLAQLYIDGIEDLGIDLLVYGKLWEQEHYRDVKARVLAARKPMTMADGMAALAKWMVGP
jgi:hypothetical protein